VEKGAWVQEVVDGGPAEKAGLRAGDDEERFQARTVNDGGDIITKVEDTELDDEADLSVELLRFEPGEEVTLEVYRDGKRREIDVELGERPEETGRPRTRP
jgi:2-alkenal reductase